MKSRDVHLQYGWQPVAQPGAAVQHPLFDLLAAVQQHGSIQRAAQGVGASYRHVWGALKRWEDVLAEPLVVWTQGHPARLTPFAERLLRAETLARARLAPHADALRAGLEQVLAQALDGPVHMLALHAGPDPALQALRDVARVAGRLHIELHAAADSDALRALAAGRCVVAGFHAPPLAEAGDRWAHELQPLLDPGWHVLLGCMRRAHGLVVAPGNPLALHTLADVAGSRARWVQRQAGSGTRLLAGLLLQRAGLPMDALRPVLTEDSANAVAAVVAAGLADAGLATATAARDHALDFVPLATQEYFLACHRDALEQPALQALRATLQDPAFGEALQALPGCEALQPGKVLPLARAQPWGAPVRPPPPA